MIKYCSRKANCGETEPDVLKGGRGSQDWVEKNLPLLGGGEEKWGTKKEVSSNMQRPDGNSDWGMWRLFTRRTEVDERDLRGRRGFKEGTNEGEITRGHHKSCALP